MAHQQTRTTSYPQKCRDRIHGSRVLERLISHAEGETEMTQSQVTAAIALLKKVLPDQKPADAEGGQDNELVIRWK